MANRPATKTHATASPQEWQAARAELIAEEKEHTRRGDELARKRRELPWLPVQKEYRLDTDEVSGRLRSSSTVAPSSWFTTSCWGRATRQAA